MNTIRYGECRGFTLIEVLISVVILSIGLLGIAGLQATGLKLNHSSFLRSKATTLAYDMSDRMRANSSNLASYAVSMSDSASTASGLIKTDVDGWLATLASSLPAGDGAIAISGSNRATITVQWQDDRNPTASALQFTLITDI